MDAEEGKVESAQPAQQELVLSSGCSQWYDFASCGCMIFAVVKSKVGPGSASAA